MQTVDEERIVTNFRIIVEQVLALQDSWYSDRKLLSGVSSRTSLGTILIWLSRGLEAVCESVNDLTFSLDSVYVDAAQRQVVELRFADLLVNDVPAVPLRGNPPRRASVPARARMKRPCSCPICWTGYSGRAGTKDPGLSRMPGSRASSLSSRF